MSIGWPNFTDTFKSWVWFTSIYPEENINKLNYLAWLIRLDYKRTVIFEFIKFQKKNLGSHVFEKNCCAHLNINPFYLILHFLHSSRLVFWSGCIMNWARINIDYHSLFYTLSHKSLFLSHRFLLFCIVTELYKTSQESISKEFYIIIWIFLR